MDVYGTNFNLGGLSGFPFAGKTGWGAMCAHVPNDGYCLTIHGPHVSITKDGVIGKVERSGIALVDSCCGSAIAASMYLQAITDDTAGINSRIQSFSDFQQGAVQELMDSASHGRTIACVSFPTRCMTRGKSWSMTLSTPENPTSRRD